MTITPWLDRLAADIERAELAVRLACRRIITGQGPHQATQPSHIQSVRMSMGEARSLLRGTMPVQLMRTPTRGKHASLIAALAQFGAHLTTLNDPLRDTAAAEAVALDLRDALGEWCIATRWRRTTRDAGIRFPITTLTRRQTTTRPERLPNIAAGQQLRELPKLRSVQGELELPAIPAAAEGTITDMRQRVLHLHAA